MLASTAETGRGEGLHFSVLHNQSLSRKAAALLDDCHQVSGASLSLARKPKPPKLTRLPPCALWKCMVVIPWRRCHVLWALHAGFSSAPRPRCMENPLGILWLGGSLCSFYKTPRPQFCSQSWPLLTKNQETVQLPGLRCAVKMGIWTSQIRLQASQQRKASSFLKTFLFGDDCRQTSSC